MDDFINFFSDRSSGNPVLGSGLQLSGDISKDFYDNELPETTEGMIFLGLAYTTCSIPSTAITWNINDWEDISITVKYPRLFNPEKVEGSEELERGDDSANGEEPTWVPIRGDKSEYGLYKIGNMHLCPDPDARNRFNSIYNGKKDWKQFFIDLLNAYQIKGLTTGHVSSYMAWNKVADVEGEYLSKNFGKLAGGAPKISENEQLRGMLRKGKWTQYRSSFATIVGVVSKMIDELPTEYQGIFSNETRHIIRVAKLESYSEDAFRDIPEVVLAYAYCWNEVTEMGIENLWSGKRAYDALSYQNRQSMMNVLKEAKTKITVWKSGALSSVNSLPGSLKNV